MKTSLVDVVDSGDILWQCLDLNEIMEAYWAVIDENSVATLCKWLSSHPISDKVILMSLKVKHKSEGKAGHPVLYDTTVLLGPKQKNKKEALAKVSQEVGLSTLLTLMQMKRQSENDQADAIRDFFHRIWRRLFWKFPIIPTNLLSSPFIFSPCCHCIVKFRHGLANLTLTGPIWTSFVDYELSRPEWIKFLVLSISHFLWFIIQSEAKSYCCEFGPKLHLCS